MKRKSGLHKKVSSIFDGIPVSQPKDTQPNQLGDSSGSPLNTRNDLAQEYTHTPKAPPTIEKTTPKGDFTPTQSSQTQSAYISLSQSKPVLFS